MGTADPLAEHPRYRKVRDLHRGNYAFVVLAENLETTEHVAIKFCQVDEGESFVRQARREITNHQPLLHPHVVQLKEVFAAGPYLALVMEFVPNGDMFQYVVSRGGLPESEARWFFQQLMLGMDYCHRKGVVLNEMQLENTLLVLQPDKKPLLKLGNAAYKPLWLMICGVHRHKDPWASARYTAPEVIQNVRGYDGKMANVWTAGVMLYTMLFARYPFERPEDKKLDQHQRLQKILHRIIRADFLIPESPAISPECRDLLQKILVADPAHRMSIAQIFQHPWVALDLPPYALAHNDALLAMPGPPQQSANEVVQVAQEVLAFCQRQPAQGDSIDASYLTAEELADEVK